MGMPNTRVNETCVIFEINGGLEECVALWTDTNGLPITSESKQRNRRSFENPVGNKEVTVRIGFFQSNFVDVCVIHNLPTWNCDIF